MHVYSLIDNLVYQGGLVAEHGLSQWLDTGTTKILLDTGQSPAFIANAIRLGLDLQLVDAVVISHGHYDHTGGLNAFLSLNSRAKVFCRRQVFDEKFFGEDRFIGTLPLEESFRERIVWLDDLPLELDEGVFVMPPAEIIHELDTSMRLFTVREKESFVPDLFQDEVFLAIVKQDRCSVLSSCSHRGITNMAEAVRMHFESPIQLIVGGFHLKNNLDGQMLEVEHYFDQDLPESIGVCHCTGVEAFARLSMRYPGHVFYHWTGNKIEIS